MVVTRRSSQSCRIWIPLYGSDKEVVSKLQNMNTIVWYLNGKRVKVEKYEYRCMVVTRKSSQIIGKSIKCYRAYKEIVSKLRNINTIV